MWNKNKKDDKRDDRPSIVTRETLGFTLGVFCVLVLLISFTGTLIFGELGTAVTSFLFGVFGFMTYFVFLALLYLAVVLIVGKNFIPGKLMTASGFTLVALIGLLVHAAVTAGYPQASYGEYLVACFEAGNGGAFGCSPFGLLGGLVTYPFTALASHAGAYILFAAGIGLCLYLFVASILKYKGIRIRLPRAGRGDQDKKEGEDPAGRSRPVSFSDLDNDRMPQTAEPSAPSYAAPSYGAPSYNAPPPNGDGGMQQTYPYGRQDVYERDRRTAGADAPRGTQQVYHSPDGREAPFGQTPAGGQWYGYERENKGSIPPVPPVSSVPPQNAGSAIGGEENLSAHDRSKNILYGADVNPAEYRNRNLIFDSSSHYNNRPQPSKSSDAAKGDGYGEPSYTNMYSREIDGENEPTAKPREIVREDAPPGGYSMYKKDVFEAYSYDGGKGAERPAPSSDADGYEEREEEIGDVSEPVVRPSYRAPEEPGRTAAAPSAPAPAQEEGQKPAAEPPVFRGNEPRTPSSYERTESDGNMSLRDRFTADRERQEAERAAFRPVPPTPAAPSSASPEEDEDDEAFLRKNKETIFDDDFEAPERSEDEDDVPDFRIDSAREIPTDRSREGLSSALRDRTERGERTDRLPPDRGEGAVRETARESVLPPARERQVSPAPARETPPKPRIPKEYVRPTLDIFDSYADTVSIDPNEIEQNKQGIVETLAGFNIAVEIANVKVGPSFTRYDITFPKNVTVKSIARCADNIAMALRAVGKINITSNFAQGTISIEVPNRNRSTVGMRTMLQAEDYINAKPGSLTFCLGKNIEGKPVCGSLVKMTHLLVAGTSGSGKSVFLHQLIVSLIMKYSPEEMRLILIDPKGNEFAAYRGLPNLMINEIISDVNRAIVVLNWLINEMEHRYTLFTQMTETGKVVRNIDEYNSTVAERTEKLPKIVVVADELADFMMQAKKDIEDRISRLAAKARAAGIHLVLATQRPSVDIITGVLKSNLSSRVALRVSSEVDSRVILDESGAENLLGMGDLLYKTGSMFFPERVQGAWISDKELQRLCNFIREKNEAYYDESVTQYIDSGGKTAADGGDEEGDGEVEPVYIDALRFVVQSGSASISMIQRKCSVGYNKAGKIIEWMEMCGYISPFEGAKSRKVLLTADEFREKYGEL